MGNELDDGLQASGMTVVAERFEVVELRRYETRPGARDVLIDIFEREFVETQEACGMVPVGHYRDVADPDTFVWFRGFEEMAKRRAALEAFYTSDVWVRNRDAANATMIDSDNVLLLRSARPGSGFDVSGLQRPALGERAASGGLTVVAIATLAEPATDEFVRQFECAALPTLARCAQAIAYFASEERPNDYPKLPVRSEYTFVVTGVCGSLREANAWKAAFGRAWETLVLEPAARSLLR